MAKSFYQELKEDRNYSSRLETFEPEQIAGYQFINKNLAYALRDYQQKALFVLQYFLGLTEADYFKKKLIEEVNDNRIPFYSFEMATGSGKTLLIGANLLYLYKKGHKDFLIITPTTPIYEKTIRNFSTNDRRTVFSRDTGLKFNLVTGETYKDRTCNYDENADINIYVFNIQKFFERSSEKQDEQKGLAYTYRPLEQSYWKEGENTISFVEFLRKRKLVIITDEAHHYQNTKSAEVIKALLPDMVLEYTATALESQSKKREQKIIYKYSIKELISQKYAKKIRALGYSGLDEKPTTQVTDADKRKVILTLLCQIVKKEALKGDKQKPLILIRCREVEHAKNILSYIQNELTEDLQTLNEVLEISKNEKAPITKLFWEWYKGINFDKEKLVKQLEKICKNSFRIDSENKNVTEIVDQWDTIEDNKMEIVVYVRMLDEGIDLNNIYLLTILSDSDTSITTNVKQAIGRGVRLFREQRAYDESPNLLKRQSELLYIVCDKNRKFDAFIESIRKEMELSKEEFGSDVSETAIVDVPNSEMLSDLEIPAVRIDYSEKDGSKVSVLGQLVDAEKKAKEFIQTFCFDENGLWVIDKELEATLDERDLIGIEYQQTLSEHLQENRQLEMNERDKEQLVSQFIEDTNCVPDHPVIKEKLMHLLEKILSVKINFKWKPGYDERIPKHIFNRQFIQFYSHYLWDSLFERKHTVNKKKLSDIFKQREITLEENSFRNFADFSSYSGENSVLISEQNIYFTGFKYTPYKYNKFDSPQERKIAIILDKFIDKQQKKGDFWVKNGRRSEYTIENKKFDYNPDFIIRFDGKWYVLEVKGTGTFFEEFVRKGNYETLKNFKNITKEVDGCLLLSTVIDSKIVGKVDSFSGLLKFDRFAEETPLSY